MNSEKKTELKVGATVFAAIIIFIFVYGWAKNFNVSAAEKVVYVNFSTAAGLEIGDLVSVNGVKKGLVESIASDNNYALVELKFREEVNLKEDATFSIMMLDLMGGKKIEISSGNSQTLLDYNTTQSGKFAGDISTAMATLSSVEADLVDVIGELKTTLKAANSIIGNSEFTKNMTATIEQFKLLSESMNEIVTENKTTLRQTLENTQELTNKTNLLLDQNSERITAVIINLDSTLSSSNKLLVKLNKLSNEVINSENNLGKFLYNEEMMEDLEISLKQIRELTSTINRQLNSGGLEVKADVDLF